MKICIVGLGYVGLVVGCCFAIKGNSVICTDLNVEKIKTLKSGKTPFFEPGLQELLETGIRQGNLTFTSSLRNAVQKSDIVFIAVQTPMYENGDINLEYIKNASRQIAKAINGYKIIVSKSTVSPQEIGKIHKIIKENTPFDFDMVINPEFLKQGNAIEDFIKPERIILGTKSKHALKILHELYSPFVRSGNTILETDEKTASMIKYTANAFLALKISFINEISNICEKIGVQTKDVRRGIGLDSRIGKYFLYQGLGWGGSCFPKDIKNLQKIAKKNGCESKILNAAEEVNFKQKEIFLGKIFKKFGNDLSGKTFTIWGLSFKPKTNDMREAPSIFIINKLLEKNAKIKAYDPRALENAKIIFKDKITYETNMYNSLKNSDSLLILTEWDEFKTPDFEKIKTLLNLPVIFDGRNLYNKETLKKLSIEYIALG